jgi:hypothetical protein
VAFPFWKLIGESLRRGKQKLFRADAKGRGGNESVCGPLYISLFRFFFSSADEEEADGREERGWGWGEVIPPTGGGGGESASRSFGSFI